MASARIYNCARCARQVMLCSHCDRGNIYCFEGCADVMREHSLKEAGKRYQDTLQGRINHARRQAEYRIRQALTAPDDTDPPQSVTHHGSEEGSPSASMEIDERRGEKRDCDMLYYCHCCGRAVDRYLRLEYLHHSPPFSSDSSCFQHQA